MKKNFSELSSEEEKKKHLSYLQEKRRTQEIFTAPEKLNYW
jgi:hypothetical protein